jgi:hypothetical protein
VPAHHTTTRPSKGKDVQHGTPPSGRLGATILDTAFIGGQNIARVAFSDGQDEDLLWNLSLWICCEHDWPTAGVMLGSWQLAIVGLVINVVDPPECRLYHFRGKLYKALLLPSYRVLG